MKAENFVKRIQSLEIHNLIGVPDSTLKQFCDYINSEGKDEFHHYVPANEGAAVGIATGTYLATGTPACVYMQNSGLGNIVNPITSLANKEVYGIPMLLLVGFRGEPGVHDEPQHKFMGRITKKLLDVLEIPFSVIGEDTSEAELDRIFRTAGDVLHEKRQYAIIVKKNTFDVRDSKGYCNEYSLIREQTIKEMLEMLEKDDFVVSTTGKISREVYEQSDKLLGQHAQEFLTVGGMGHASMIALGIAEQMKSKKVFCIDGDGAVLMHMGALPFIGKCGLENYVHICLNNEAHESVGGMPTGARGQSYADIASVSGYKRVYQVRDTKSLKEALQDIRNQMGPIFLEIKVAMDSRENLGRPKETAIENKVAFMKYHGVEE